MSYRFYGRVPGLVFEPWIGAAFAAQSLRLFFVGHSHYGTNLTDTGVPDPNTTIEAVCMARQQGGLRFFTGVMQMACGLDQNHIVWDTFYQRIAFANLLQDSLDTARRTADPRKLHGCVPALCAVLDEIAPTHVILLGGDVWSAFESHGLLSDYQSDGKCCWKLNRDRAYLFARHPSARFSSPEWAAVFGACLAQVKTPRRDVEAFVQAVRYDPPSRVLGGFDASSSQTQNSQ